MRASGASELRKFSHFHILKLIFPWQYILFGTYDTLSQKHYIFRSQITSAYYTIHAVSLYYLLWYMALCINDSTVADKS